MKDGEIDDKLVHIMLGVNSILLFAAGFNLFFSILLFLLGYIIGLAFQHFDVWSDGDTMVFAAVLYSLPFVNHAFLFFALAVITIFYVIIYSRLAKTDKIRYLPVFAILSLVLAL